MGRVPIPIPEDDPIFVARRHVFMRVATCLFGVICVTEGLAMLVGALPGGWAGIGLVVTGATCIFVYQRRWKSDRGSQ